MRPSSAAARVRSSTSLDDQRPIPDSTAYDAECAYNHGGSPRTPSVESRQRTDWCFDEQYNDLLERYARSGEPVSVNFRQLVPLHSGVDRATHLMHAYPAKLLLNIPLFFLNCSKLSRPGDVVLDPFCGTGTTLVEALLAGRYASGADSNPLARLIAQSKVTPLDRANLETLYLAIKAKAKRIKPISFDPVMDVDRWFSQHSKKRLGALLAAVRTIEDTHAKRFFEICLSSCIRKVSYADPRLSVPVRKKLLHEHEEVGIDELFERVVAANIARLYRLTCVNPLLLEGVKITDDARNLGAVQSEHGEVDLIITSPPYAGAQKYIRASSLSIGWLGLAPESKLRNLERLNIGREHFSTSEYQDEFELALPSAREALREIRAKNPLRAHIAAVYLAEMRDALLASHAILKSGGYFVLVVGDNNICGQPFTTSQYLREIMEHLGFSLELELVDDIRSRGLMTKRNKTAGLISREHIFVMRK